MTDLSPKLREEVFLCTFDQDQRRTLRIAPVLSDIPVPYLYLHPVYSNYSKYYENCQIWYLASSCYKCGNIDV